MDFNPGGLEVNRLIALLILVLSTFIASSIAHSEELPSSVRPKFLREVKIKRYENATIKARRIPANDASVAVYRGKITLQLVVEGNICDADPESLSVLKESKKNATELRFYVAAESANSTKPCPDFSKETTVTVSFNVEYPVYDRSLTKETYAFTTLEEKDSGDSDRVGFHGGSRKTSSPKRNGFRIAEKAGELQVLPGTSNWP